MKKGDWVVCVTDDFKSYTKGKKYQLLKDVNGTVLEIENDRGYRARPSLNGYDSGKRIIYFDTKQNIREQKLNQLLNNE
jgi:hypothetical protein